MVLNKQSERPMLIIAWGRFLKMFYECYPESRPTRRAADGDYTEANDALHKA